MSKEQIFVVLATCLATNRGSFGPGDDYPCASKDEAKRMVEAGQASWPKVESVSKEAHEKLQLSHDGLTTELAAANEKLQQPSELPPETIKKIADLTESLGVANAAKTELDKRVESMSKELVAVNKKLKAAIAKAK